MKAYKELERQFTHLSHLEDAMAILHWDAAVMMPTGGAETRAETLAALTGMAHHLLTDPLIEDHLQHAEATLESLSTWEQANLREMRREWRHANAVEGAVVTALSKASSECEMVWREARKDNDFKKFAPYLKKVLTHVRCVAQQKSAAFHCSPYDALLDYYDPGRKSAEIDNIFSQLAQFLPDFIQQVVEKQRSISKPIEFAGTFPIELQKKLGLKVMQAIGFDFAHGRLDISHHPFCGGVPSDVRITTRYYENDFLPSLMGVIHETGHALYENNLPKEWRHQPVGKARGMSIHESQSLLMEMQACRSKDFLVFLHPHMKEIFNQQDPALTLDNLYHIITQVSPSLIRVDADEVTYPAHIILRYNLEKAMIEGNLEVDDLPEAWNQGMQQLLGIRPDSDKNGCMQDIHWPGGDFGYFPTYTLGAIIAAQLFAEAKQQNPSLLPSLRQGNFAPLIAWLQTHIHQLGSLYDTSSLLIHATGKALDVGIYMEHLKARYLSS